MLDLSTIDTSNFGPLNRPGHKPMTDAQIKNQLDKQSDRLLNKVDQKEAVWMNDPAMPAIGAGGQTVRAATENINAFNILLWGASEKDGFRPDQVTKGRYWAEAILHPDRVRLSVGRPAQPATREKIDPETGRPDIDPETGEVVMEDYEIPAIPALPLTLQEPEYDPETGAPTGNMIDVPNPPVAKDEADRAEAEAILAGLPDSVRYWEPTT